MKNMVGIPARGENFFPRENQVRRIIDRLTDGNNLHIAAPRRIGKTSILLHLLDNREGGYIYVYIDTEDIDNEDDFFKRILKEVLKTEEIRRSQKLKGLVETGHKLLGKIKSIKIMGHGIDFVEGDHSTDPREDLVNLLEGMELEENKKIVLLIDEFPQTIQNILDANPSDEKSARKFLQMNREIRMNPSLNQKVRFILTGSIGLNHTVTQIGASAFINDVNSIEIGPLSLNEAKQFLAALLSDKNVYVEEIIIDYLLERIEWLIPFHLQLAVQEILGSAISGQAIDREFIDRAFDSIIQARNDNHFNHYYSRLRKQFKGAEFLFASELLEMVANKAGIKKAEIFDLSAKYNLEEKWRQIVEILIYDGYINRTEEIYRFNSPIVRMWWQRFIGK